MSNNSDFMNILIIWNVVMTVFIGYQLDKVWDVVKHFA